MAIDPIGRICSEVHAKIAPMYDMSYVERVELAACGGASCAMRDVSLCRVVAVCGTGMVTPPSILSALAWGMVTPPSI